MTTQNFDINGVSFDELNRQMADKVRDSVQFGIGSCETQIEQLQEAHLTGNTRHYGDNVIERIGLLNQIKESLEQDPCWWPETAGSDHWIAARGTATILATVDLIDSLASRVKANWTIRQLTEDELTQTLNELEVMKSILLTCPEDDGWK